MDPHPYYLCHVSLIYFCLAGGHRRLTGAIGLILSKDLKPGMKVIKDLGLLPSMFGYPIH